MNGERNRERPRVWARFGGPALTAALAILIETLRDTGLHVSQPPAFFNLAIVYSGFSGGLLPALVSAFIAWGYTAYYFLEPGQSFSYSEQNLRPVVVWAVTMPLIALLVGLLKLRGAPALAKAEVAALRQAQTDERSGAEEVLRQSRLRYEELVHSVDGIVWEADPHTFQFSFVSPRAERILGYPAERWISEPNFWIEHVHPEDREWAVNLCRHATGEKRDHEFQYRMQAADGRFVWLHDFVTVVVENDRAVKLRGLMVDITERKQAEEERQAHLWFLEGMDRVNRAIQGTDDLEQLMRDVLDGVLSIFGCDRAWLLYPCDPEVSAWWVPMECTRPEYPGAFAAKAVVPMDAEVADLMRLLTAAGRPVAFGPRHDHPVPVAARPFGVASQIAMAIYPRIDRPYMFGIHQCSRPRLWKVQEMRLFQEIGHRLADALTSLLAYRNLRASERKLAEAQRIAHVGYWDRDIATDQISWSAETYRIFGLPVASKGAVAMARVLEMIHPADRARVMQANAAALRGGPRYNVEYRIVRPSGEVRVVHSQGDVTRNESGQPRRMFGTVQDITERKQAEEALRESERRLEQAERMAHVGWWDRDIESGRVSLSDESCRIFGLPLEQRQHELPQWHERWRQLIHPEDRERAAEAAAEALQGGTRFDLEYRVVWPDGQVRIVRSQGDVIRNDAGHPLRLFGTMQDITDLRQAERELLAAEARFRTFVDHASDALFLHDARGTILDVNRQACDSLGYTREELIGMNPSDFDVGVDRAFLEGIGARLDAGEVIAFDTRHRRQDGTEFPVELRIRALWEGGRRYGVSLARDITERKLAEEALRESQERLRLAVEATGLGPWDWDIQNNVVVFSPEWLRQIGYAPDEIPGRYEEWESRLHPEDRKRVLDWLRTYLDGQRPEYTVEFRLRHKDGSYRWIYTRGVALRDADGKPLRMLGCHLDITERKLAEQALFESHSLVNAVVEGSSDAIFVKDRDGRYLMINSAGARFLGKPVEGVIGKRDGELFTPDIAQAIRQRDVEVMATGQTDTFEEIATAAGVTRTYLSTKCAYRDRHGNVVGVIGIARDITEQKRLEEQFRQAQKMEAVGRLAGGVAHDFNNLLTVIIGYSAMMFGRLHADDPNRDLVAEMQKAGDRAATLVRQLLAFSRKQMLESQVVSLNSVLSELHKMLQRLIGEDCELAFVPDPDLELARVDPGQFEQAIINLAVNARDAMAQSGRLTIETQNADLDDDDAQRYPELKPGRYVRVSVSDTGHGMDEATKERVFEPFFTTKELGKGTGLGLAMVYGFVKQSEGHIEVDSEVGRGTTFRLYLPRAEAVTPSHKLPVRPAAAPRGTETVLLVEDEGSLRTMSRLVLQSNGYTVLEARDGQEGLEVAQQHAGPIHLLITDMVMPRMSGRQLAETLVAARPDLRVLFISGYTEEDVPNRDAPGAAGFLRKPFSPISLARKAREVLDGR